MRRMLVLVLLAVLPATGCLEEEASQCEPMRGHAVVQEVSGRDARVTLDDGQPAVLHLSDDVFVLEAGGCRLTGPEGVRAGDSITFEVDAWAESYPVQGWPEKAVVVR